MAGSVGGSEKRVGSVELRPSNARASSETLGEFQAYDDRGERKHWSMGGIMSMPFSNCIICAWENCEKGSSSSDTNCSASKEEDFAFGAWEPSDWFNTAGIDD